MRHRSLACILAIATLPLLLGISGGSPSNPGYGFGQLSDPYVETVVGWMVSNTISKALAFDRVERSPKAEVEKFFNLANRSVRLSRASWDMASSGPARTAALSSELLPLNSEIESMKPAVESSIQDQIAVALKENGFQRRIGNVEAIFPPVMFRFEALPNLLVVSPRERIERATTVLLKPRMMLEEAEALEQQVWNRGYSGLVVQIGGLGIYPSMVPEGADFRWTLRTIAHEWTHQFLTTRPLGWRYAFGAENDSRIISINETVAEIVGREIGDQVYDRYYRDAVIEQIRSSGTSGDLDVRAILRDVREKVDELLAQGKVDEAESLMESSRQELVQQGYSLRKLNQAYYAFHGTYADSPVSVGGAQGDDIGERLHALRQDCASVGEFAWLVSSVDSYRDFWDLRANQ